MYVWEMKEALQPIINIFLAIGCIFWVGLCFAKVTYFLHKKFNFFK